LFALIFFSVIAFLLSIIYLLVYLNTKQFRLNINQLGHYRYCLVLGAGLEKDGKPSDILMDRVSTAVCLFNNKQVDLLIMSGTRRRGYDEPGAMQAAAIAQGVPDSAILLDPQGISTLDSYVNFKQKFAHKSLVVITQPFHLPRSILLARKLGLDVYGTAAGIYHFSWYKRAFWYIREFFALPYNFVKLALFSH
jgi:vancomycin permeability regulator SanA